VQPLTVQIFIHKACGVVLSRVEAVKSVEVAKRQRKPALLRAQAGFEQTLERPSAAQLIAVYQSAEQHMASGLARVELPHAFGASVARTPVRQVGRRQIKGRHIAHHSSILANSTIFLYLATSLVRNWSMLTVGEDTVEPLASSF